MPTHEYIITLKAEALTAELRKLLESKGAEIQQSPLEEVHLPPEEEKALIADLEAIERGDYSSFKSIDDVEAELKVILKKGSGDG